MSWLYTIVFAGLLFSSGDDVTVIDKQNAALETPSANDLVFDETEKFEKTYPITAKGRISVSNVNGSIVVEAWDKNEVRLEATKIADSKETLADADIDVDSQSDSFSVKADYKSWNWSDRRNENRSRRLEVQFHLWVPRTAVLNEIETVNGSVSVSNFTNFTKISAVNGNVTAANLRGAASLSTVNGEVSADFDQLEKGSRINLTTVNGRVQLSIPSDANATIKADSLNGSITNDFGLPVRKGQYVGRDLYGKVGSGEVQIRLNSVNGRLAITRKNDGKNVNPATNLLPEKGKTEDWENEDTEGSFNSAQLNRDVARAVHDAERESAKAVKDVQKAVAKIKPELEKIKIADLEKLNIQIDTAEMQKSIAEALRVQSAVLARMDDAIFLGAPRMEKKTNTFIVKGTQKISLDAKNCNVKVRGWDKPEVRYVLTELSGRRDNKPATVKEEQTGSGVSIVVVSDGDEHDGRGFFHGNSERRLEVFVPRKSDLRIESDGEIRLEGVSGSIELIGNDGAINVRESDGKLNVSNVDGQIRIVGFRGELDAETTDGDVFIEGDFSRINGKSVDGRFVLTLPENIDADIESPCDRLAIEDLPNNKKISDKIWRFGKGGRKYQFTSVDGSLLVQNSDLVTANE